MLPTAVCVLRSGGEYTPAHVAALYDGVRCWWPSANLRFVCLTDMDMAACPPAVEVRPLQYAWPGWWSKMELCSGAHDDLGSLLYFDLDTVIVGPLIDIATARSVTLLQDFYHPTHLASGMMLLPVLARTRTWQRWILEPASLMHHFRHSRGGRHSPDLLLAGDGGLLDLLWREQAASWQALFPGQVISYKCHVLPNQKRVPAGARVVCFHGRPKPWEISLIMECSA